MNNCKWGHTCNTLVTNEIIFDDGLIRIYRCNYDNNLFALNRLEVEDRWESIVSRLKSDEMVTIQLNQ